jgi:hypothetical protein
MCHDVPACAGVYVEQDLNNGGPESDCRLCEAEAKAARPSN